MCDVRCAIFTCESFFEIWWFSKYSVKRITKPQLWGLFWILQHECQHVFFYVWDILSKTTSYISFINQGIFLCKTKNRRYSTCKNVLVKNVLHVFEHFTSNVKHFFLNYTINNWEWSISNELLELFNKIIKEIFD